jgi:hypothetical protein
MRADSVIVRSTSPHRAGTSEGGDIVKKLIQVTALTVVAAVTIVAPAAAKHGPGDGPIVTPATAPSSVQVIRVVQTSGFDWSDAAVGAGTAAGVVALASGAALLTRRRRADGESAPSPASA